MRTFYSWLLAASVTMVVSLSAHGQEASPPKASAAPAGLASSATPTPRTADGHPDLSGMWGGRGGRGGAAAPPAAQRSSQVPQGPGVLAAGGANPEFLFRPAFAAEDGSTESEFSARDGSMINLEEDRYIVNHAKSIQNEPLYKPEYWDKVRHLNDLGYRTGVDPGYPCYSNPGLTRLGMPVEIVQFPKKILLIYAGEASMAIVDAVREIPIDGSPLPSPDDYTGTKIMGVSVGHWEGDTLVIETVDIAADATWLGNQGWFHSGDMKVTERLRRNGNTLALDMTVDDSVLLKPWVLPTAHVALNTNSSALVPGSIVCMDGDAEHLSQTQ